MCELCKVPVPGTKKPKPPNRVVLCFLYLTRRELGVLPAPPLFGGVPGTKATPRRKVGRLLLVSLEKVEIQAERFL